MTAQAALAASTPDTAVDWPEKTAALLDRLRAERTRVHAITNAAAQALTANLLLAAGGTPSLTIAPEEITAFAGRADALLVNLGTLDGDRRAAIPWGIAAAKAQGKPWVLDPVFVDASPPRLELARLCLAGTPCVVRLNAAEFAALAGEEASEESVAAYAERIRSTVALTGPVDWVTDGERFLKIENGHPLMAKVTAMGCATTALVAAFAALERGGFTAAVCGLLAVGIAAEVAGEAAAGPGSFAAAFLDALYALDAATLAARARLA
ncbi:MAG TPA: hydroxyethylthiazole kinase [Beijerinckiaceae bacterium]